MQKVKRWSSSIALLGLATFTMMAFAQDLDVNSFDVTTDPDFQNYRQVLTTFAAKHRPNAENTFCVLGLLSRDNTKGAWVFWREGNRIIFWEGSPDLDSSRRKLNLKSDVVATVDDLHGSTYRVTQSWVADMTNICDRSGVKVQVPKKTKSFQPRSRR
jgi:hypothetical protein